MSEQPQAGGKLEPLGLVPSIILFAVPAAILVAFVYLVIPVLAATGMSPFMAYAITLQIPLALMLIVSVVAYRLEGNPLTWTDFKARFRLHRMTGRDWLWTLGLAVFSLVAYGIMSVGESALISSGLIQLPAGIPIALDPRQPMNSPEALHALFGGPLQGNWLLLGVVISLLCFNIFGEEFWWRGYILPRQELAFGKNTWLIHGVMWALFHIFKWWDVVSLLPVTLALSYVAQRRQNTWPGIISHFVVNGLSVIGLTLAVAGVLKI